MVIGIRHSPAIALLVVAFSVGCSPVVTYPGLYPHGGGPTVAAKPAAEPPGTKQPIYRLILSTPAQAAGHIQLSKFKGVVWDGTIRLKDDAAEWTFTYTNLSLAVPVIALGISLTNRLEETIEIDWNKSAIVDRANKVHRIIHRGVKIVDRDGIMPPSVIPPGATLEDFVYPADLFFFGREWWGAVFFEDLEPGQSISVSLSVKIREHSTKRFVFQALPPIAE